MALCKLDDVKVMLNISPSDTSHDDKLNLMIKQASAEIEAYLGYRLQRADYTEELHAVNCRQLLQLNNFPIQSVTSVTRNDEEITDFKIIPQYSKWGGLYRGDGWCGRLYTQTFEHDIVSGAYDYKVSYTAGYYLPGDEGYVEGAINSLPYDIYSACCQLVCLRYNYNDSGATGLKSHSEGGISDTYGDSASEIGLTDSIKNMLSKWVFYGVA
jgi:hypothetical protein